MEIVCRLGACFPFSISVKNCHHRSLDLLSFKYISPKKVLRLSSSISLRPVAKILNGTVRRTARGAPPTRVGRGVFFTAATKQKSLALRDFSLVLCQVMLFCSFFVNLANHETWLLLTLDLPKILLNASYSGLSVGKIKRNQRVLAGGYAIKWGQRFILRTYCEATSVGKLQC